MREGSMVISATRSAEARRGPGRLRAGVAAADDDDVVVGIHGIFVCYVISRLRPAERIISAIP